MKVTFIGPDHIRDILGICPCHSDHCKKQNLELYGRRGPIDTMAEARTGECFFCGTRLVDPVVLRERFVRALDAQKDAA